MKVLANWWIRLVSLLFGASFPFSDYVDLPESCLEAYVILGSRDVSLTALNRCSEEIRVSPDGMDMRCGWGRAMLFASAPEFYVGQSSPVIGFCAPPAPDWVDVRVKHNERLVQTAPTASMFSIEEIDSGLLLWCVDLGMDKDASLRCGLSLYPDQ